MISMQIKYELHFWGLNVEIESLNAPSPLEKEGLDPGEHSTQHHLLLTLALLWLPSTFRPQLLSHSSSVNDPIPAPVRYCPCVTAHELLPVRYCRCVTARLLLPPQGTTPATGS